MRLAVVGHVEWIDFLRVERVPAQGEIIHASRGWGDAAGGGAVAAVQLANLAGSATFFTTFGADARGRQARERLEKKDVRVLAREVDVPQRYGVTFVDDEGERTITVVGERLTLRGEDRELPWGELETADGVYFVSGDAATVRRARQARVLVAATRSLEVLKEAGVELDAIVGSATDAGERYRHGDLYPAPRLVVRTEGAAGGSIEPGGRYEPVEPPGTIADSYGCGDCFAAGFTYGLAAGMPVGEAAQSGRRLRRHGSHRSRPLRAPVQARRLILSRQGCRRCRRRRGPELAIAPSQPLLYELRPCELGRGKTRETAPKWFIGVAKWGVVVYSGASWITRTIPKMLSGEYEHTLDEKNRLTLPARFRARFAEGLVLTRGMERCLSIFTGDEFSQSIEDRLAGLDPLSRKSRDMRRYYFAGASEAVPDKQGRVMVPQALMQKVGIAREVVVVGVLDHLEVWDRDAWRNYMNQVEESVEDAAERIAAEHD